jgi:hypothetical protein
VPSLLTAEHALFSLQGVHSAHCRACAVCVWYSKEITRREQGDHERSTASHDEKSTGNDKLSGSTAPIVHALSSASMCTLPTGGCAVCVVHSHEKSTMARQARLLPDDLAVQVRKRLSSVGQRFRRSSLGEATSCVRPHGSHSARIRTAHWQPLALHGVTSAHWCGCSGVYRDCDCMWCSLTAILHCCELQVRRGPAEFADQSHRYARSAIRNTRRLARTTTKQGFCVPPRPAQCTHSPLRMCTLLTVACGLCVCVLFRYIFKEKEHAGAHPTPDRTRTLSGRRPRGRPPLSAHAPCPCLSARALRLPARLQVPPCNVHVQGDHTLRPPSRVALLTTPHWILGVTHQVSNLERRTACVWSLIAGGAAPLPQDVAPPLVRAPAHFCAGDVELRRLTAL